MLTYVWSGTLYQNRVAISYVKINYTSQECETRSTSTSKASWGDVTRHSNIASTHAPTACLARSAPFVVCDASVCALQSYDATSEFAPGKHDHGAKNRQQAEKGNAELYLSLHLDGSLKCWKLRVSVKPLVDDLIVIVVHIDDLWQSRLRRIHSPTRLFGRRYTTPTMRPSLLEVRTRPTPTAPAPAEEDFIIITTEVI